MKLRKILLLSSLVLAFAALGPATAQAVSASPAVAGHQVPFLGILRGVETTTAFHPPTVEIQGTGTGIATHLGRFTYDNPHTVNLARMDGCGTLTFTTSNGTVSATNVCGKATVVSGTVPTAVLSIVEAGDITGGTGRFAGATGRFTVKRLLDQKSSKTVGYITGTISSRGDDKH
jgi:hypothetical protein